MTTATSGTARHLPAPDPALLDPDERMPADELSALQLERLQWTVRHAYDNVPLYRTAVRRRRRAPGRHPLARRRGEVPVHDQQGRPAARPTRSACSPCPMDQVAPHPRLVGHDRPADGRRLHERRPRHVGDAHGAIAPRGRRPAGHEGAQRLRLRAVHRRPRRALRHREARCHGHPGVRWADRAAGAAHPRLRARRDPLHAQLPAHDRRRDREAGHRSAGEPACKVGVFGAEPWTERDAARARAARSASTPSTSTDCQRGHGPGRRQRVRRDEGRPAHLGGPLPTRGHRRRSPARCSRTARRASWSSPRSPRRPSRSSATAPATSPACCPAPRARGCAG